MSKNIYPGHNACAGCGQLGAVQAVMRGLNKNTVLVSSTGCLEVTTTAHPQSSWGLAWMHSLFENSAAVASGIRAALDQQGKTNTKVVVQAGDGATYDIGLGFISGMWARKEDILYICYDTEAYSNTGVQASSSTPWGTNTKTTPISKTSSGNDKRKKDMIGVALAHGLNYIAQSTNAYPDDITNKVRKALNIKGPSYIQILSSCAPAWLIEPNESVKVTREAVLTGLYPLLEFTDQKLSASSINSNFKAKPVTEYLKMQKRFKHLTAADIEEIEKIAKYNIEKYNL